jgi:hypothetical protein
MKLIFLDIDGVLNSHPWMQTLPKLKLGTTLEWGAMIDPTAVERLNRIVDATGAAIVVSSSWRNFLTVAQLRAILKERGFHGLVIASTPRDEEFPPNCERGTQIDAFLKTFKVECGSNCDCVNFYQIESFVILDDDADMAPHMDHLVRTTFATGLQDEHVEQAIAMLSIKHKGE